MSTNDDKKEGGDGGGYDRWKLDDPTTIQYGYSSQTYGKGIEEYEEDDDDSRPPPFYITTAINYTNGPAHMGHAYEGVTSDVIARFYRTLGDRPVFFLTGADEHGQKIANTAAAQNQEPLEICNKYVIGFQRLNQRLLISNDDYVRTTSQRHKDVAQALWKLIADDIYLDTYEGWYNIREETFVTDTDAALWDYKDPVSGVELRKVKEVSYFFRMSKYHDRLVQHLEEHPNFIQPTQHYNSILRRLKEDNLRDLSISRTTFDWGIPVPDGFEENHVMYVWVDALSNYLTGVEGITSSESLSSKLSKFWPASIHIIGKDILWFHTVIWPCLLMSANLQLPKQVYAHGFVNDAEGKKMSKSLGNVVNPHDMLDRMEIDTFRWYLCKEAPYGGELSFNYMNLQEMHNADLCDTLGNLIHRATNLCHKYCKDGLIPNVPVTKSALSNDDKNDIWPSLLNDYCHKMKLLELQSGASIALNGFRMVNGYLTDEAPWLKKGPEYDVTRQVIVRTTLEAIYVLTHLLIPFLPQGTKIIFDKLGTKPKNSLLKELTNSTTNLKVGTKISVGNVLYTKLGEEEDKKDDIKKKKKESLEEAQRRKKEKQAAAIASSQAGQGKGGSATSENQLDFYKLDIRIGKITKVWNHESAEKLYCEEIDMGSNDTEMENRQVASGLRQHYTLDEMQDKLVLVVCNLKATKLVGFTSQGMVLAAKSDEKVELVEAPEGSKLGERVFLKDHDNDIGDPLSSSQVKKRKMWDKVAAKLQTNQDGIATWDGKVIQTSVGPCKVTSLSNAPIS